MFDLISADALFRFVAQAVGVLGVTALGFIATTLYLRYRNDRRAELWGRLAARWQEPLLRVLEGSAAPEELWEEVEDRYGLHFVNFLLRHSRRVRGREREHLREAARPYLRRIVEQTRHGGVEERTRAVQTLGELGLPDHADELVARLDDESPLVAMVAARALTREGHVELTGEILVRLDRFRWWWDGTLSSMLAKMGAGTGPHLRRILGDETASTWLRAVAADALANLADLESADLAGRVAEEARSRELLSATLGLLGRVGRSEHREVVRTRCESPDFVIRSRALRALGRIGGEEDLGRLRQGLFDPSPWVALHAARALWEAGGAAILEEVSASDHPRAAAAHQILFDKGERGGRGEAAR